MTRNWRTWNFTSASALEEWNGDLWWYDTPPSIGTEEVHVSRLLRCCDWRWRQRLCWPRLDVIFRAGVELGIKVNLHTPRCICEGNVSRDWYGEHVWSMHGEMRCRILLRLRHSLATARHTSRPSAPQSSCLSSEGGDVDPLPDVSICCQMERWI